MKLDQEHYLIITKITSIRPDFNGCILKCRHINGSIVNIKGDDLHIDVESLEVGDPIIIIPNNQETHNKYGTSYKFDFIDKPLAKNDVLKILENIKTIGHKKAENIYNTLEPFVIEQLLDDINNIYEINGLSRNNINHIIKWFNKNRDTLSKRRPYLKFGFTVKQFNFIQKIYGLMPFEEYIKNPYRVLDYINNPNYIKDDDDPTFTFKEIDNNVMKNHIQITPLTRCNYAIDYVYKSYLPKIKKLTNGDTMFKKQIGAEIVVDILSIDNLTSDLVEDQIEQHDNLECEYITDELTDETHEYYIHKTIKYQEQFVFDYLINSQTYTINTNHIKTQFKLNDDTVINLTDDQVNSIELALSNQYSVITGGPGSGKTTTINALIQSAKTSNKQLEIFGYAPTGKAVNRMKDILGVLNVKCKTIASLSNNPSAHFEAKNPDNTLVIVDESSMIDTNQMYQFLRKIPKSCQIIFIGDHNQLPPIGYGQIFKDLVQFQMIPIAEIKGNQRQMKQGQQKSNILEIIDRIRTNTTIHYKNDYDITMFDTKDVKTSLLNYLNNIKKDPTTKINLNDLTIISPYSTGKNPIGTFQLNRDIHHLFNNRLRVTDLSRSVTVGNKERERTFVIGDRVVNTKNLNVKINDYTTEKIMNGDIGKVININRDMIKRTKFTVTVEFDHIIYEYTQSDIKELQHAYALTVHKAQGSEFTNVIVLLPDYVQAGDDSFMVRNMIYTAVSRAKSHLILISSQKALKQTISNQIKNRFTYFHYQCQLTQ